MKSGLDSYILRVVFVLGLTAHLGQAMEKDLSSPLEFLNDPAEHTYASLSFELPLTLGELDPSSTKMTLNSEISKKSKKLPLMSMEEPWQKNLHITITGFPNIPSKYFKDPELLSQFEQVVQGYKSIVSEMIVGSINFQLDTQEPTKVMPYKTTKAIFAIPSKEVKDLVNKMTEAFLIVFKDYTSALSTPKRGKLGIHMSLDINERKYYDPRTLGAIKDVLSKNILTLASARATVLYHTERWK